MTTLPSSPNSCACTTRRVRRLHPSFRPCWWRFFFVVVVLCERAYKSRALSSVASHPSYGSPPPSPLSVSTEPRTEERGPRAAAPQYKRPFLWYVGRPPAQADGRGRSGRRGRGEESKVGSPRKNKQNPHAFQEAGTPPRGAASALVPYVHTDDRFWIAFSRIWAAQPTPVLRGISRGGDSGERT